MTLDTVTNRQVAPTVAAVLGVPMAGTDGKAVAEVLDVPTAGVAAAGR